MSENTDIEEGKKGRRDEGNVLSFPSFPPSLLRFFSRCLSLSLVFAMVFADPSFAAGMGDFIRVSFSHDLGNLSVPGKFGAITDRWIAPIREKKGQREEGKKGSSSLPPSFASSQFV